MNLKPQSTALYGKAKALRQNSTPAEQQMWYILRNRKVGSFKFRRQHPILNFVADFYCAEAKIIIELDGQMHATKEIAKYDLWRKEILNSCGIMTLRFDNESVFDNADEVIRKIELVLRSRTRKI